jgi:hypothetical protein
MKALNENKKKLFRWDGMANQKENHIDVKHSEAIYLQYCNESDMQKSVFTLNGQRSREKKI